jgi:hypothetical protein
MRTWSYTYVKSRNRNIKFYYIIIIIIITTPAILRHWQIKLHDSLSPRSILWPRNNYSNSPWRTLNIELPQRKSDMILRGIYHFLKTLRCASPNQKITLFRNYTKYLWVELTL